MISSYYLCGNDLGRRNVMSKILSDYLELREALEALPKPPKDTVRVFRGQTAD